MASQSSVFIFSFIFVRGHFGLPITKNILKLWKLFSVPPTLRTLPSPPLLLKVIFFSIGHVFVLHLHFNSFTWHDMTLHNFTLTHLTSYTCMDVGGPFYTLTRSVSRKQYTCTTLLTMFYFQILNFFGKMPMHWITGSSLNYNNETSAQLYLEIKPKLGDTTCLIGDAT